jgi:general stress protein YciG
MPNQKLVNKVYDVPPELQSFLGPTITYQNLKMTKSRLKKAQDDKNVAEFDRKGGENVKKWIDGLLKKDRDAIYNTKKIGMDTGRENQFLKTHDKDQSKNPTKVGGLPKIGKGSVNRKIMTNTEVYNESINKELKDIIYLMEYMDNNKKQTI